MTPELLRAAVCCTAEAAERFAGPLSAACAFYGIDTSVRLADFMAQVGHESGSFRYMRELWGPTDQQLRYERDFDSPWPETAEQCQEPEFERNALAFRLGNAQVGDGARFKGRGGIQHTGRYNYARLRARLRERFPALGVPDFEAEPERLEEVQWACLGMCDYWDWKGLNTLADAGDFIKQTKRINGGLNGLADRRKRRARAKAALQALSQASPLPAPIPPSENHAAAIPGPPVQ